MQNNHTKEILFRKLCYEKVVLLLSVTVKILYLECCVMKKLLYCCFFVRSNNLNSFFQSNCPRFIQIDLASLGQFRKPRTICPGIHLKTG